MIISERKHRSRKEYKCGNYIGGGWCKTTINPGVEYWRIFGSAEPGDKPYELLMCLMCYDEYN